MGKDIIGKDSLGSTKYAYYLSLCGPLTSSDASSCLQVQSQSSACQIQVTQGTQTFDIGNYDPANPPAWKYTADKSGVTFDMNGAIQW